MIGPDRSSDAYPLTDRAEVDAARCLLGFAILEDLCGDEVEPLTVTDDEAGFRCRLLEEE